MAARRYRRLLAWVILDAKARFGGPLLAYEAMLGVGMAAELAAVGVAMRFARWAERGAELSVLGTTIPAASGPGVLVAVGGVGALMLLGAVALYRARTGLLRISNEYAMQCVSRALTLGSTLPSERAKGASQLVASGEFFLLVARDTRAMGTTLRHLARVPIPALVFLGGTTFLLRLAPGLTLAVYSLFAVVTWYLYRIGRKAAAWSRQMEAMERAASEERIAWVERVQFGHGPLSRDDPGLTHFERSGSNRQWSQAYVDRMGTVEATHFVNRVVSTVMVALVLGVFSYQMFEGGLEVSLLVSYILMLRLVLGSVREVSTAVTVVNRFYPSLNRYWRFVTDAGRASPSGVELSPHYRVRLSVERFGDDGGALEFGPTRPVALCVRGRRDRALVGAVLDKAKSEPAEVVGILRNSAAFVLPTRGKRAEGTVRSNWGLPLGMDCRELKAALLETGLREEIVATLPESLDAVLGPAAYSRLSPRLALAGMLLGALFRDVGLVLLDGDALAQLPEPVREHFRQRFEGRTVMVAYEGASERLGILGEQVTVLVSGREVRGQAPTAWVRANPAEVAVILGKAAEADPGRAAETDQDLVATAAEETL